MLRKRVPTWVAGVFLGIQIVFLVVTLFRWGGVGPGNIFGLIIGVVWFMRSRAQDQEFESTKEYGESMKNSNSTDNKYGDHPL